MLTCKKCKSEVTRLTYVTGIGALCDYCHANTNPLSDQSSHVRVVDRGKWDAKTLAKYWKVHPEKAEKMREEWEAHSPQVGSMPETPDFDPKQATRDALNRMK